MIQYFCIGRRRQQPDIESPHSATSAATRRVVALLALEQNPLLV